MQPRANADGEKEERLVKKAVRLLFQNRAEGDILMDAPEAEDWDELVRQARDRKSWQAGVKAIKDTVCIVLTKGKSKTGKKKRKNNSENEQEQKTKKIKIGASAGGASVPEKDGSEDNDDESEEEEEGGKDDSWGTPEPRTYKKLRGRIKCNDGFAMSIQASRDHYSTPRDDTGPYSAVEVGYPNELEQLLMQYCDAPSMIGGCIPPLYVNVPAQTIRAVVAKHAGLRSDSEQLPELIELDENGYQWAAAAIPPSPSPTTEEDTATEEERDEALTSVIHLGAPPPPPPPLPVLTSGTDPPTYYPPPSPTYIVTSSTEESEDAEPPPYVPGCDRDINRTGYLRYRSWARRHPDEAEDQHPTTNNNDENERRGSLTPPQELMREEMSPIGEIVNLNDSF